jgi:epsilon-lactone hydrolase
MQSAPSEAWSAIHAMTPRDRIAMGQMRAMVEANKGKLRSAAARRPFNAIMDQVAAPDGVSYRNDTIDGVAGWWCEAAEAEHDAVILHAHGGWFTWGSAESFRHLVGHIARSARARAFVPDYRLAPENPFPAAVDDVRACYLGLVARGVRAIALTGDSAGGNLALSVLALITAQSPADSAAVGAVVLSR